MTYLSLTFFAQNNLIVHTNANGTQGFKSLRSIQTILGPFANQTKVNSSTIILEHRDTIFGSKNTEYERMGTTAKLCLLIQELYSFGWKTTCKGASSIFDHGKRRGHIFFT